VARAVLESYAVTGVLGLARREGNRRYYDFVERLFPAELLAHQVPLREQARLRDETEMLAKPPAASPSVAFLAPLDPLVWDRAFLRTLFDLDYVWEVYVPERKRRWGYYVLPVLFGDRLVGRIEPRIDRTAGVIRMLGVWWEHGFDPRRADGFVDAMRGALRAYLDFAGAGRLEWATDLGKEKRLFRARP
jgi:uncharacterized protein